MPSNKRTKPSTSTAARRKATSPQQPSTKKDRRDEARRERAAILERQARRKRTVRIARVLVPVVVLGVLLGFFFLHRTGSPTTGPAYATVGESVDPATLPGIQIGPTPWVAEESNLQARLSAIGFPALPQEALVLHIHQHIDIYVNGGKVTIPALIGIHEGTPQQGEFFISPIHTHDSTGIIHVESPTHRDYTLGEFFDVWGVRFTSTCIGGYCNDGGKTLRVWANGHPVTGNPRQLTLTEHEEIVVAFGTDAQLPQPIPSSYGFPFGL
jgi:hypothetical protein